MKNVSRALLLLPVLAAVAFVPPGSWVELAGSASEGGLSDSPEVSTGVSIDIDSAGNPVAAWADYANGIPVHVVRWNPATSAWTDLTAGLAVQTMSLMPGPCVRAGSGNTLFVAYVTGFIGGPVMVKMFDGTTWSELGGSATGNGISGPDIAARNPSMVIDANNRPCVSYQNAFTNTGALYFKRYNGNTWIELGGSGSPGIVGSADGISYNSLALDPSGKPTIAFCIGALFIGSIRVVQWNGAWVGIGDSFNAGLSHPANWAFGASLAFDAAGMPAVAWAEHRGDGLGRQWVDYLLKRWNGATWDEVGPDLLTFGQYPAQDGAPPSLATHPGGKLIVTYATYPVGDLEREVFAKTWSPGGTAWEALDGSMALQGISNTPGAASTAPVIAAGGASGTIAIAWSEKIGEQTEVYLRTDSLPVTVAAVQLRQVRSPSLEPIETGVPVLEGVTVKLGARVFGVGQPAKLEVELKPIEQAFDATAIVASAAVPSGSEASIDFPDLAVGQYHWRARAWRTSDNERSPWINFGGAGHENDVNFVIANATQSQQELLPPGGASGKKCSASGEEAGGGGAVVAVLMLFYMRRRSKMSTTLS